ncbi:MAG TPA: hypothetical protein QGF58_24585 [Myxococcota bacterium]|nr:hypothetical protein [Myxococcota bacterium]
MSMPLALACTDPASQGPDRPRRDPGEDTHSQPDSQEDTGEEQIQPPETSCTAADASMSIAPDYPETGQRVDVSVTANTGYVYIHMAVAGGDSEQLSADISGDGP